MNLLGESSPVIIGYPGESLAQMLFLSNTELMLQKPRQKKSVPLIVWQGMHQ
jgi:hypothetical protein